MNCAGDVRHPVVLIASACRWRSTVELAKSLASVGFKVGVLAPPGHPIEAASLACTRMPLSGLRPSRSLAMAMAALEPDLVIPADEMIVLLLHELHRDEPAFRDLIERSLGAPENYAKTISRVALAEVAQEVGVSTPRTVHLTARRDLAGAAERLGLPAFVKIDAFWGGAGVIRVETAAQCAQAYSRLSSFLKLPRVAWRVIVHRDTTRLPLRRTAVDISMQSAVSGVPANCAVAAWRGELLACVEAEALKTLGPTGSSTVIRLRRDQPMRESCRRLVKRLGLSGLIGFDFILEQGTGRPILIELNARATQTCHLRVGSNADPAEALRAAVTGEPVRDSPAMSGRDIIELFPRERFEATGAARIDDIATVAKV